ncbi:MAG TPA: right-handed parallel beta-helix repeat-containing protein, partial [Candidatus Polarisedimenticolaceae bacterium]|nr:right-handed parallel beta-helix repeat-containing protein [Candidatus Polarisedimenticolaceae bacterium]
MVSRRFPPRGRVSSCLVAALWVCVLPAAAQTVYVDDDTCPAVGSGTDPDPYCRIQDAICALNAGSGGTVMVRPGTYDESLRMFPGISVISTDGPAVTMINADGRPCITQDCLPSAENLSCSAVVWGQGATNDDRLEGFRITGGSGLFRDFGGGDPPDALAGGGIFVFDSSPTITNNEIVDNALSHANATKEFWGGGIYLGGGSYAGPTQPVITYNLIQENAADPDTGNSNGLGGGIYVGLYSAPVIDSNTIRSNKAGDTNKTNQRGGGGGLVVYSISPAVTPTISMNLIQDNVAADFGGGLALSQAFLGSVDFPSQGKVENNVFELNRSFSGGALNTTTTNGLITGNTFADNTADFGGAITIATSENLDDQATLINNLVAFNTSVLYGAGGVGVYYSSPSLSNNLVFGNIPNDIDGALEEDDVIGVDGNLSADPLFVSREPGARDLRLTPGSAAVDVGDNSQAPDRDFDNGPRVLDGDSDGVATIDIGAYELVLDTDGDGEPDYLDGDDDGDGVADAADCAPADPGASIPPQAVGNTLIAVGGGPQIDWTWSPSGFANVYNFYRGTQDAQSGWSYALECVVADTPWPNAEDPTTPAAGVLYYYLVAAASPCGDSVAGMASDGTEIYAVPGCALGSADQDDDGTVDRLDNCVFDPNAQQIDTDRDGRGNVCDSDDDDDGLPDAGDNCPLEPNANQADGDGDGDGDVCDNCPATP